MTVKPIEQAQEVGKQAREQHIPQAASEALRDLRGMTTQQRQEFFGELSRQKGQPNGLPGLEIHGGDGKERKSVGYEGQRPMYQEPDGTISRGQGPYDALAKGHPDWPPSKVQSEAARVNRETGRPAYREGEKIQLNNDGSVTLRSEHPGGTFDEVQYKDKKPVSSRHGDDKGNWSETQYDAQGKPKTITRHEQGEGGNYKETVTGADGKEISTKTRTTNPDGSYKERTTDGGTGSQNFKETDYDANGKPMHTTERKYDNPNDPNTYSEKRTDGDGKPISEMKRHAVDGRPGYYAEDTTPTKDGQRGTTVSRLYYGNELVKGRWDGMWYTRDEDPERLRN
ncbi:MAG TPA: hypothetical protein V6C76_06375 [Drouetiella sp.]